jgi:hypothetical protein
MLFNLFGAGDEARTRDLNLGKVALYQLSYSRIETIMPKFDLDVKRIAGQGTIFILK